MSVNKYQSGKIYKIYNNENSRFYLGSTIQKLSDRMNKHTQTNRDNFCMSQYLGVPIDECIIELIENYPCNTEKELLWRERFYFDKYKLSGNPNFLNQLRPIVTKEETIEKQKQYYIENKKQRHKYQKNYRKNNPDKRTRNKPQDIEYNEKRKKIHKQKTTCKCGSVVSKGVLTKHKKSKTHIQNTKVKDFLTFIENSLPSK